MNQSRFKPLQLLVFMIAITSFFESGKANFCTTSLIYSLVQLIPCSPSLSTSHPTPPSDDCCNALKAISQPCLCNLLNAPLVSGIDYNSAMLLHRKCATNFKPCF